MQVIIAVLASLGTGLLIQLFQIQLGTTYINRFLENNLITILVALLAINSATTGIILSKIRDLVENHGNPEAFSATKSQMTLSIKEQIGLIICAVILLTVADASIVVSRSDLQLFLSTATIAVFVYGLHILYDTAMGVMAILDFDPRNDG